MNLEQLKSAGFNDSEIQEYVASKSTQLTEAGFSQEEIAGHFGTQPEVRKPFMGATRSFAPTIGERAMDIGKQVFEAPKSLGEVGLMMGTGFASWVLGSGHDIAVTGYGEATKQDLSERGDIAAEEWGKAVWQPETPAGKKMGEWIGKVIEVLMAPAKEFAHNAGASWDSPLMEKVVRFVAEIGTFKKLGEGAKGVKAQLPEWYGKMPKKEQVIVDNMVKELVVEKKPIEPAKTPVEPAKKPLERPVEAIPEKPIPSIKGKEKVAEKQPWEMTRGEYVEANSLKPALKNLETGEISVGERGQIHADIIDKMEGKRIESGWVDGKGRYVDFKEAQKINKGKDAKDTWKKLKDKHEADVAIAYAEGKQVPKKVLAEYPDLKPVEKIPEKPEVVPKADINEMYAKAMEIADKEGKPVEVKRLQDELREIGGTITTPAEMRKLRQTIHAWSAYKGLTKSQLTQITKKETGHLSTTHKNITAEQLKNILNAVAKTRPRKIGWKQNITKETETRIVTLKNNLLDRGEITEEAYQGILSGMRIKEPKYISRSRFITESEGKKVIDKMLKSVPISRLRSSADAGLNKMPAVKKTADTLDTHFKKEQQGLAIKNVKTVSLLDMHHFADAMQKQTGKPFGDLREAISHKRHDLEYRIDREIEKVSTAGGEDFLNISNDKVALKRINDYVASNLPEYVRGKPQKPKDITSSEKAIAEAMIEGLRQKEGDVRYNRFYEWRDHGTRIPNAPDVELKKANKILETEGDAALRKWLDGRSWGVIRSGYDVGEVINPSIKTMEMKPGFGKRGLRAREAVEFQKYEKDILRRYASYIRQMTYRTELKPLVDAWVELFEANKNRFADPGRMAELLTRNIRETLGQKEKPQVLEELIIRAYSQAARAIFLDVRKGVRNLFQNVAFYTNLGDVLKMEKMSKADKLYFEKYVSQMKGIQKDWLYQDYRGVPGFSKLNEWADQINVMGRSDTVNRLAAFKMKTAAVRAAIKKHPGYKTDSGELTAMMKESQWGDIEPMERRHALDVLAREGEEAMVHYVADATVKKVHFLYERAERSPSEQGNELSRVASNLLTFRKGYVQRAVLDARKLRSGEKMIEKPVGGRKQAVKSITGMTVMGAIASWFYMQFTGDKRMPYAPHMIIGDLSLGGLATGMQEQIGDFTGDVMRAVTGDKVALGRAINGITRAGDSFVPFYNEVIFAIEGLTDYRDIDKATLRQIRSAIDSRYKAKPMGYYKKKRDAIESAQHIIFGTEQEEINKPKKSGITLKRAHKIGG